MEAHPTTETDLLVIGAGFSGVALATHLREHGSQRRILLVDPNPPDDFGPAYRTDCALHLLNTPAKGMSAYPQDPLHFANWANARDGVTTAESFAERRVYRAYIADLWSKCEGVTRVVDTVATLHRKGDRWEANLVSGDVIRAESVVLATGFTPSYDLPALRGLAGSPQYIADVWAAGGVTLPPSAKSVGIIGSGLTAVDAIFAYEGLGLKPKFTLISRHALFPQAHADRKPGEAVAPEPTPSIRKLVRAVRKACETADFRNVVDAMRPRIAEYWRALTPKDKALYVRRLRVYWEGHRHRMPPEVAARIGSLIATGRLELRKGTVCSALDTGSGILVKTTDGRSYEFDVLINCTGPGTLHHGTSPLIRQLLDDRILQADELGMGVACDENGEVPGARGLFTLGVLRRGELYESTAVRELAIQAEALATYLK